MSSALPHATQQETSVKLTKDQKYYLKNREEICRKARDKARWKRQQTTEGVCADDRPLGANADKLTEQVVPPNADGHTPTKQPDLLAELMNDFWNLPQLPSLDRLLVEVTHNLKEINQRNSGVSTGRSQYDKLLDVGSDIARWSAAFGGISAWPTCLDDLFTMAKPAGGPVVVELIERLWLHQAHGRTLLARLEVIDGPLPVQDTAKKVLWYEHHKLVVEVVRGLTILDLKLPIMYSQTRLSITSPPSGFMVRAAQAMFRSNDGQIPKDFDDEELPPSDEEMGA